MSKAVFNHSCREQPHHMTKKGAMTYTNWIMEQIFQDAKILAAIYPPETCREILAKHKSQTQNKVAGSHNQSIK